jgi:hypothetical protein
MGRKSQVEKFYARQAKKKVDDEVIYSTAIERKTLEERGEIIAENNGMSTEEIFAVIGRNSIQPFIRLWNNSMESVIKEHMRNEIKDIVREVIREELTSAVTGFIKGMDLNVLIPQQPQTIKQDIKIEPTEQKVELSEREQIKQKAFYEELEQAIKTGYANNIEVHIGRKFKESSSRNNGLYQVFLKYNKGIRGAWVAHVNSVMKNNQ